MAECEEDDKLETDFNQKSKTKQEKGRKKKSVNNYLHECEDDILDFTEATSNRKILSKFKFFNIYFSLLFIFPCIVSKPTREDNTNIQKSSNIDNSIKTAPDGRLIISDEPQALPTKSGKTIFDTI